MTIYDPAELASVVSVILHQVKKPKTIRHRRP